MPPPPTGSTLGLPMEHGSGFEPTHQRVASRHRATTLVLIPIAVAVGVVAFAIILTHLPPVTGSGIQLLIIVPLIPVGALSWFAGARAARRPPVAAVPPRKRTIAADYRPGFFLVPALGAGAVCVAAIAFGLMPTELIAVPLAWLASGAVVEVVFFRRNRRSRKAQTTFK